MEHLAGWTLEDLVRQHGPLPSSRAIHLLRQVCAALREAHGIGLVHRDMKPAKIITCLRGGVPDVAKLLDFGLVRRSGPPAGDPLVTSPGSLTGTPAYMSPEQAGGQADVDARSDIYSLGAVAYYLVTGQPPFVRNTAMRVLMAHLKESPQPPSLLRPGGSRSGDSPLPRQGSGGTLCRCAAPEDQEGSGKGGRIPPGSLPLSPAADS